MPSMGFYQEKTLEGGMLQTSNGMEFSKIAKVGKENINGHPSTKFKTRFVDNEGKGVRDDLGDGHRCSDQGGHDLFK